MKVYLIGVGTGGEDFITVAGKNAIEESGLLIGAKRLLQPYSHKKNIALIQANEIVNAIKNSNENIVSVLFSGDVGFYSGAKQLLPLLETEDCTVDVIAGISSVQYFCSKILCSWDDARLLSAHGRSHNVVGEIQCNKKSILLTGSNYTAKDLISELVLRGLENVKVTVGEQLSYDNEKITTGKANELLKYEFSTLAIVLVENDNPIQPYYALRDDDFIRGKVPMTKEEIRIFALSRLRISPSYTLWDVGAGTGSVSVEMARLAYKGQVFAVEEKAEAVSLIGQNKTKFNIPNLNIIHGKAPDALENLPNPDCIFIGGTRGNLEEILKIALHKNPNVRIVITAITLETLIQGTTLFATLPVGEMNIVQLSATRMKKIGGYNMMDAQNPVWVMWNEGFNE